MTCQQCGNQMVEVCDDFVCGACYEQDLLAMPVTGFYSKAEQDTAALAAEQLRGLEDWFKRRYINVETYEPRREYIRQRWGI